MVHKHKDPYYEYEIKKFADLFFVSSIIEVIYEPSFVQCIWVKLLIPLTSLLNIKFDIQEIQYLINSGANLV